MERKKKEKKNTRGVLAKHVLARWFLEESENLKHELLGSGIQGLNPDDNDQARVVGETITPIAVLVCLIIHYTVITLIRDQDTKGQR